MFERLHNPQEAYNHELGAALKMEQTVLDMLDENVEESKDDKLKQLFRHHQEETRGQITNLESAFRSLGWEVDTSSCPAIEGIEKEAKANVKKSDDSIVDSIILQGAAETEHHEIAVYEGLIIKARAMGRDEVVRLLEENLEQERHTLQEVTDCAREKANASVATI